MLMKHYQTPDNNSVDAIKATGLGFNESLLEKTIAGATMMVGTGAVAAGGVGTIKIIMDKRKEEKIIANAGEYLTEFNDDAIESKVQELKATSDLNVDKAFLKE